jgi:large subunit ribosomal protein L29
VPVEVPAKAEKKTKKAKAEASTDDAAEAETKEA